MRRKTALQFIYILHIYKNMNYDRNGSFNSVVESFLSDLMMLLLLLMLHWWSSVILFSSVQRATMSMARCSKDIPMYINLLCQISALRHCTHMWISSESTGERCCDCMQTATVTTCVIVFSSSGEALQAHTHTHTYQHISAEQRTFAIWFTCVRARRRTWSKCKCTPNGYIQYARTFCVPFNAKCHSKGRT